MRMVAMLIGASVSISVVLWKQHWDASAVHEDDLPGTCSFLQKGRFQPFLIHDARGVRDTAFINVGNPRAVAADVDVRFGHVPFVASARGMLGLDEVHDGFSIESGTSIEHVKV